MGDNHDENVGVKQREEKAANPLRRHPFLVIIVVYCAAYALLYKLQWVPGGGDDAYYLAVARNLVRGDGLEWAGRTMTRYPPGWAATLATVLRFCPYFAALNIMAVALLTGAACLWYGILKRYASERTAFWVVLMTGLLFEWHRFSYTLYSESLFALLLAGAVLLALQISEGRAAWWRMPLLAALCAAMPTLRWAGVLVAPVVAGALLPGELLPRVNRRWACAALAVIALAGSFLVTFRAVEAHARPAGNAEETASIAERVQALHDRLSHNRPALPRRIGIAGQWLSMLFWPPATVGLSSPLLLAATVGAGWVLVVLLCFRLWPALHGKEWLWIGAATYWGALVVLHHRPVARYLTPVAPLFLLGVVQGFRNLRRIVPAAALKRLAAAALVAFLAATVACNAALFAVNACVIRSPRFQLQWTAGEYGNLLAIAQALEGKDLKDGELAVSVRYTDPYRRGDNTWARRLLYLLTDRIVRGAPTLPEEDATEEVVVGWARDRGVRFVVVRPPEWPSRIWHFRLGDGTLEMGVDEQRADAYYRLYEITEGGLVRRHLQPPEPGPRRIPGL